MNSAIGLGDANAQLRVYVAKRPPMQEYASLAGVQPLARGEIDSINQACGNGWRKLFNVYAKLVLALPAALQPLKQASTSWQSYRDQHLLQAGSSTALLFSAPQLDPTQNTLHIIAGRTHAKALLAGGLIAQLDWLDHEFAMDKTQHLLVCPYFDYRQLSNDKLARLCNLIAALGKVP
ncbi:DUF6942 family protein [Alkalimonas amylolytica]|uniref:Uncharacterized protein n=1 Tax=Alkalimonas amylolytica TaxID=152573 RepID=A0A1H4DG73_ALKAM|nr:hypothetical protein [Alkalimonas amylolytica]SEA71429.1 hypothetical protein SAMN04488051_105224 [Alkalimonas amylolytica]